MKTHLSGFIASAVLSICACTHVVVLRPEGQSVRIVTVDPGGCVDVGSVFGKSLADGMEQAMRGARADLRNRAGALGASTVVLETNNSRSAGYQGNEVEVLLEGRALKCSK